MVRLLEIACFNAESALVAAKAGAHRIEFCTDYPAGGLTPSAEDFLKVRNAVSIPIVVMIRPRSGKFLYTSAEFNEMKSQISNFKSLGADGFVFGILDAKKKIDIKRNSELITLAETLPCTLHRAFDETPDLLAAMEGAITCGFKRILTAGGKGKAEDNIHHIKELVIAAGDRISIIPGSGVRSTNVKIILEHSACAEIHSAAVTNPLTALADTVEIEQLAGYMI